MNRQFDDLSCGFHPLLGRHVDILIDVTDFTSGLLNPTSSHKLELDMFVDNLGNTLEQHNSVIFFQIFRLVHEGSHNTSLISKNKSGLFADLFN